MKVAVIGAGIAGLSTARALGAMNISSTIFEREDVPGGRVATHRLGDFVFDAGAQSIVPYASELGRVITTELDDADLIRIEKPVFLLNHLRPTPGDPGHGKQPRYTYRGGNVRLADLLAAGLDIRYGIAIDQVESRGDGFSMEGDTYDAIVATMPVPQASLLQWGLGIRKPTAQVQYRTCTSVLLGYARPAPETPYHALLNPEDTHPLQWLSLESVKCPGRAPEGSCAFVAQLNDGFSRMSWDWEDGRLVSTVTGFLASIFGNGWSEPVVAHVRRWKYSQPETIALFDSVNRLGDRLILAGDGLVGGRIEYAFDSGMKAARLLKETL